MMQIELSPQSKRDMRFEIYKEVYLHTYIRICMTYIPPMHACMHARGICASRSKRRFIHMHAYMTYIPPIHPSIHAYKRDMRFEIYKEITHRHTIYTRRSRRLYMNYTETHHIHT